MRGKDLGESGAARLLVNAGDCAALAVSVLAAYLLLERSLPYSFDDFSVASYVALAVLCYVPVAVCFPPLALLPGTGAERVVRNAAVTALSFILVYVLALFMLHKMYVARSLSVALYLAFTALLLAERLSLRALAARRRRARGATRAVLVGHADEMGDLYLDLIDHDYGLSVEGVFTDDSADDLPEGVRKLGPAGEAPAYVRSAAGLGAVYCSMGALSKAEAIEMHRYCENSMIHFYALPVYVNYLRRNMVVTRVGGSLLLSPRREPLREAGNRALKRATDIAASLALLLTVFPPVYAAVALLRKRRGSGPLLVGEKRRGIDGKVFTCLSFAPSPLLARTRLSELPQLVNVLRGDMSLVGPQPHTLEEADTYTRLINSYPVRHSVKPGMVSYLYGRGARSKRIGELDKRVRADIWYVENWSLWLDASVAAASAARALLRRK